MEPQSKIRALALIRAAVVEDESAIAYLLHEPPTGCFVASLAAVAASVLEEEHGVDGALLRLDTWARYALAEVVVAEESS